MSITIEELKKFHKLEGRLQELVQVFNSEWELELRLKTRMTFPPEFQQLADKVIERSHKDTVEKLETMLRLETLQLLNQIQQIVKDYPEPTLERSIPDIPF